MTLANLSVLDCTLRDGGFYNDWDFESAFIRSYLETMARSRVNIVEVGYRSIRAERYFGMLKFSSDTQLAFLRDYPRTEFAVMIDLKEYLRGGRLDTELLASCFSDAKSSPVTWVRVAANLENAREAGHAAEALARRGYRTTVNLMQVSLASAEALSQAAHLYDASWLDVLYFADSFGSLDAKQVTTIVGALRSGFRGAIGVHAHANLELALSNSLGAVDAGASYVDATLAGMGRGAGNLRLEHLLLWLQEREGITAFAPHELVSILEGPMATLQRRYRWGATYSYALSALENIHPTYCQRISDLGRYTEEEVVAILKSIAPQHRAGFSESVLDSAVSRLRAGVTGGEPSQLRSFVSSFASHRSAPILIVGTGPSVATHREAIQEYIREASPIVLECNATSGLEYSVGARVMLHPRHARENAGPTPALVTGSVELLRGLKDADRRFFIPYAIRDAESNTNREELLISGDVVGMYALALAERIPDAEVLVVGFDGYEPAADSASARKHDEMAQFLDQYSSRMSGAGRSVTSATPTSYDIPATSIYHLTATIHRRRVP